MQHPALNINFLGNPKIIFVIDTEDKQLYDNAIEKIDFVLELLPYHLDPEKLPSDVLEISYKFDPQSARWRLNTAKSENKNIPLLEIDGIKLFEIFLKWFK